MLNKPLVSVLMTSYNREKYIAEAIESVLDSTYKNFELIIVDDGSKDLTVEISKAYQKKDNRIKVFINKVNLGDYPNRNKAASYATGKYIKYVDADDKIYPHGLEVMITMMEKFPDAGYGLCSRMQDQFQMFPVKLEPDEAYRYHYLRKRTIFTAAPLSAIIRKDAFEAVNGFSGKRMVGDFELWSKLSLKYPLIVLPTALVWYRHHDEQESVDKDKYALDALQIAETGISASAMTISEKKLLLNKVRRTIFIKLLKNPMKLPFYNRWQYFKNSSIDLSKLFKDRG